VSFSKSISSRTFRHEGYSRPTGGVKPRRAGAEEAERAAPEEAETALGVIDPE